jgi:hypothetical protein
MKLVHPSAGNVPRGVAVLVVGAAGGSAISAAAKIAGSATNGRLECVLSILRLLPASIGVRSE